VLTAYEQPSDYRNHDPKTCPDCLAAAARRDLQDGVLGLLSGAALSIKPEGYDDLHRRGRTEPNTVEEFIESQGSAHPVEPRGNGHYQKEPIWQRES